MRYNLVGLGRSVHRMPRLSILNMPVLLTIKLALFMLIIVISNFRLVVAGVTGGEEVVLEGVLGAVHKDFVDEQGNFVRSETTYDLLFDDASRRTLLISPRLQISDYLGERVRIYAFAMRTSSFDGLAVSSIVPLELVDSSERLGPQRTLVLLLRFADVSLEPKPRSFFQSTYTFGADPSLERAMQEITYGLLSVQNAGVYGWYTLPGSRASYTSIDTIAQDAFVIAYNNGIRIQNNDRIIFFLNGDLAACSFCSGISTLGYRGYLGTPFGMLIVSGLWMSVASLQNPPPPPGFYNVKTLVHEYHHNLGILHSGVRQYDSSWDVVSGGCFPYGGHTISLNKIDSLWLTGASALILPASQRIDTTLYSTTSSSGLRAIKITTPDPNIFFTIEYRKATGYDRCLPNSGVIIHKVFANLYDLNAKPIDATPGDGTLNNAHWLDGQVYNDIQYGFSIRIGALQPGDGVQINIRDPLLPPPGQRQIVAGWKSEEILNREGTTVVEQDIATDTQGSLHATWIDDRSGFPEVYYKRLDHFGNLLIADRQITHQQSTFTGFEQDLAVDRDGNVHIVWLEQNAVFYAKIDGLTGLWLLNPRQIVPPPQLYFQKPVIEADADGNVQLVLVASPDQQNPMQQEIYYAKLQGSSGNVIIPPLRVSYDSRTIASLPGPRLSVDGNGDAHLVWESFAAGTPIRTLDVAYTKINGRNGQVMISPIRETTTRINSIWLDSSLDIATDSRGDAFVTWNEDHPQSGGVDVYLKKIDGRSGAILIPRAQVTSSSIRASDISPTIGIDATNNVRVAWVHYDVITGLYSLYYAFVDGSSGMPRGAPTALTPQPATPPYFPLFSVHAPILKVDRFQNVWVAWLDQRDFLPNQDVYYAKTEPTVTMSGVPSIGNTVTFSLLYPHKPDSQYAALLSFGQAPTTPLPDRRYIPLRSDALFFLSLLQPGSVGFVGSIGQLANGAATFSLRIPSIQELRGLALFLSVILYDQSGILAIAPATSFTVL